MVLNPDECSFMLLGVNDKLQIDSVFGNETLKNNKQEKVCLLLTTNSTLQRIKETSLKMLTANLTDQQEFKSTLL